MLPLPIHPATDRDRSNVPSARSATASRLVRSPRLSRYSSATAPGVGGAMVRGSRRRSPHGRWRHQAVTQEQPLEERQGSGVFFRRFGQVCGASLVRRAAAEARRRSAPRRRPRRINSASNCTRAARPPKHRGLRRPSPRGDRAADRRQSPARRQRGSSESARAPDRQTPRSPRAERPRTASAPRSGAFELADSSGWQISRGSDQ